MAENEAPQGATEATADNASQTDSPKVTDWKAEARKWESRAKQSFAEAEANKDAAKRLAEIEEAQKSEAQKAQERLDAAEKRAAELELKAVRAEVAAAKGVPVALLSGSTKEELEASADALIEFRGEQEPEKRTLHVPNIDKQPRATTTTADAFAAAVEGHI